MKTFDTYYEYIKSSFKDYPRIKIEIYNQHEDLMMIRINPKILNNFTRGDLHIKFDDTNISFFWGFLVDEYMEDNDFVNVWEKYNEAEIYAFLDKKIKEYKYYIDNGYFFNYYDSEDKWVMYLAEIIENKKFDEVLCEKVYHSFGKRANPYSIVKKVVISNFYGEVVDTVKVNE